MNINIFMNIDMYIQEHCHQPDGIFVMLYTQKPQSCWDQRKSFANVSTKYTAAGVNVLMLEKNLLRI